LFEGGINVPFIARWPGQIAAGKVDHTSLISAVDLLPTFCEIAGAQPPPSYVPDGVSQVATLKGRAAPSRSKPLFWRIGANWPPRKDAPDHWAAHVVVDAHWKLLVSPKHDHFELYDLQQDSLEKSDLSQALPDVVTQLHQKLKAWHATLPARPSGNVFSKERTE
jgi:arylsulfatase A-like enzyme